MKWISFLLVVLALATIPGVRGQDAATEERLNKLSGRIDDLRDGQEKLRADLERLSKAIESLRADAGKPKADYAAQEDLKRVADAIKEVDRKRMEDNDTIRKELKDLGKSLRLAAGPGTTRKTPAVAMPPEPSDSEKSGKPDKGFEYIVKKGDTLDAIVQAYAEKSIKITTAQILKANPGMVPEKMHIGQKIWIPAPQ